MADAELEYDCYGLPPEFNAPSPTCDAEGVLPFHLWHDYNQPAKPMQPLACAVCTSTQFEVAVGSYRTAIRCPSCRWEWVIHEG